MISRFQMSSPQKRRGIRGCRASNREWGELRNAQDGESYAYCEPTLVEAAGAWCGEEGSRDDAACSLSRSWCQLKSSSVDII